jgi:hypothetical protein
MGFEDEFNDSDEFNDYKRPIGPEGGDNINALNKLRRREGDYEADDALRMQPTYDESYMEESSVQENDGAITDGEGTKLNIGDKIQTSNGISYKVIYDFNSGMVYCVSDDGEKIPANEFDFSECIKSDSFSNGNGGFASDIDKVQNFDEDDDYGMSEFEDSEDEFIPHGSYTLGNAGGYEIMIDDSGDMARVRDAYGSDNPETSDWLEIEYIQDENGESEPVIDPNGYNIPLNMVMKIR